MLRVVCSERDTSDEVCAGEERIVVGRMRLPTTPVFPDEADERAIAHNWNVSMVVRVSASYRIDDAPIWSRLRQQIHRSIADLAATSLPPNVAGVVLALVVGNRSGISAERWSRYQRTGTAHMFSVSGSHVGLIFILVTLLLSRWRGTGMVAVTSMLIISYVMVTGAESPAIRAACMGIAVIVARRCEWDLDGINVLCGSVILLALADPWGVDAASTVLSVSAVLGMLVLVPIWTSRAHQIIGPTTGVRQSLLQAVAVSVAASTAIVLPSVLFFKSVSVCSVLANIVAVPLLSLVFVLAPVFFVCSSLGVGAPIAWTMTKLVQTADVFLVNVDAIERIVQRPDLVGLTAALSILVWWWPTVARMHVGAVVRFVVPCTMIALLPLMPSTDRSRLWLYEGVHGTALGVTSPTITRMYVIGAGTWPIDHRVVRWARSRTERVIVVGHGRWGARMAARIQHDVVGSNHVDSSRASIR
jgi:ComEC/Rec2-related protein